jgi:hypothetical protein
MSSIDFSELIISKKGVISSDNQPCGNIIGERDDKVIVEQGRSRLYYIPKSKIRGYDGAQLQLDFPFSDLSNYEERSEKTDDYIDKATDMVSGGINKATDTVSDTANKAKDVFRGKGNTAY